MKLITSWNKGSIGLLFVTSAVLILLGVGGCTSYNPYTGTYEPDAGKTMAAVGTAAFAASVIHHEVDHHHHDNYHRPSHHYHYHNHRHRPPRHRHY